MSFVCYNGEMLPAEEPLFSAANRSFRYGDGLFETIKVVDKELQLSNLHFDRLFTGLQLLQIKPGPHFTPTILAQNILELCAKNKTEALARVRLAVFRSFNGDADYVIESFPLAPEAMQWNQKGWQLVLYPAARKSCDAFANLKSANYLPYVLAQLYATEKGADEALVLNAYNNIADGSKTNLFLVKNKALYTPALHQGCVNGVMRQNLLAALKEEGYEIHQTEMGHQNLLEADEVFCTNAIQGIRWVKGYDGKNYHHTFTEQIFQKVLVPQGYRL